MRKEARVAAAQFAVGTHVPENLAKSLHWAEEAGRLKANLVVMPEFVNHLCWYHDQDHCYHVAMSLEDAYFKDLEKIASRYDMYIVTNITLKNDDHTVTATSLLIGASGILGRSDKDVLIGHENDFLKPGSGEPCVVDTDIGRIGLYACMEGVLFENPRLLGVKGADIICNSLNSFAFCEAQLHIPVRAAENKVFVVAANKIGPLIPQSQLKQAAEAVSIPERFLEGAGESQIVGPDGSVIKKATLTEEGLVYADIEPQLARNKQRSGGSNLLEARRPELYTPLMGEKRPQEPSQAKPLKVALCQIDPNQQDALSKAAGSVCQALSRQSDLIVLPELFFLEDGAGKEEALLKSKKALDTMVLTMSGVKKGLLAASFLTESSGNLHHEALLIDGSGICHRQEQLHLAKHTDFSVSSGDSLQLFDSPFGKIALLTGEDVVFPEIFRVAALNGAELFVCPFSIRESWESRLGLIERSAENRVPLVACTRPSDIGHSVVCNLTEDFTIMTPWPHRAFDGYISHPIVTRVPKGQSVFYGEVNPERGANKTLSHKTHLLDSRPSKLLRPLCETL